MIIAVAKLITTHIPRRYLHSLIISGGVIRFGVCVATGTTCAANVNVGSTRANIDSDVTIVFTAIFINLFPSFFFVITSFERLFAKKLISSMDGRFELLSMLFCFGFIYLV